MKTLSLVVIAIASALPANPAHAAYVLNFAQVGTNVVATGSGSVITTGLNLWGDASFPTYMTPSGPNFVSGNAGTYRLFQLDTAAPKFGTGGTVFGSQIQTVGSRIAFTSGRLLGVSTDYVSGSALGTTVTTFTNATFASLGLTAGSYVWTWGTGLNADRLTINVGPVASAVPEPAGWAMMIGGFGLVGGAMRRRKIRVCFT